MDGLETARRKIKKEKRNGKKVHPLQVGGCKTAAGRKDQFTQSSETHKDRGLSVGSENGINIDTDKGRIETRREEPRNPEGW